MTPMLEAVLSKVTNVRRSPEPIAARNSVIGA
jgi:hypothetical protein